MMTMRQFDVRYDVCGKMGICSLKMRMYVDLREMCKKSGTCCKDVSSVIQKNLFVIRVRNFNREYEI